jgi:hypothetical protein
VAGGRWRILAAILPALLVAVRLADWWPCDIACQGGAYYQRLLGVPVLWPALACYLLLAALAWPARTRPAAGLLAWALAGTGALFLAVAFQLGLRCPFCLSVHGAALAAALALRPWPGRAGLAALLLGLLGANAAFHHRAVPDLAEPASTAAPAADPAAYARADRNRMRGRVDAPLTLEAVLDLQCPHCAADWSAVARLLAPAVESGRMRLVVRCLVRRGEPASRELARWSLAAALAGPAAHGRAVVDLLGTRPGIAPGELLAARSGELAPLDAAARAHAGALDALLDHDLARIRVLGPTGATPLLVLTGPDGRERGRWRGVPEASAFADAVGGGR